MQQINNEYAVKQMNEIAVNQRIGDGYINATALCKASGKLIADYFRLGSTKEFLSVVSRSMGIPIDVLVSKVGTGLNEYRGTWVHPYIAINLGQWISPEFAFQVSKWVHDWMVSGYNIELEYQKHELFKDEMKTKGSESGRFLANLRWHVNPSIKEKDRYFEENRQLSLFPEHKKVIH